MAGTQRTGTTLLRTSLSSHPEIICHGEIFNLGKPPYRLPGGYWAFTRQDILHRLKAAFLPERSYRRFLAELYGQRECKAIGFKLMLSQCKARPALWPVVAESDVKVILVTRRNVLKTLISRRAAAASGVYHVSASLPVATAVAKWESQPITIDSNTIIRDLDEIAKETAEWKERLSSLTFMELIYEEYFRDQSNWNAKVLDFIGVPERSLTSDLKKVNSSKLEDLIVNYDEIAGVVRDSDYSFCLDLAY